MTTQLRACITLDLESDHAGQVPKAYDAWQAERVEALMRLLARHNTPLTAFVVADTLRTNPDTIAQFLRHNTEFHLHSYSHDLQQPDSPQEIQRGIEAFQQHFGQTPIGYRAPEGRISPQGWQYLQQHGFLFDASIFPAIWPRPHYLRYPREPFEALDGLLEIPFSTVSPLRIIVSLSWMKLLGWNFFRLLLQRFPLPQTLIVGLHLHDLWTVPAYDQLSPLWKFVYRRNQNQGPDILDQLLDLIAGKGYHFTTVGAVAHSLQE